MGVLLQNGNIVGGIDSSLVAKIGTTPLTTIAQNLSSAINELNSTISSVFQNIKNYCDATFVNKADCPFPVGYVYMSIDSANPSTIWTNTEWTQIKDTFLLTAGDTYAAGSTGGNATVNTGIGVSVTGGNITYKPAGSNSGMGVTMNAVSLSHSGGAVQNHTLTTAQIPSHTHSHCKNGSSLSCAAGADTGHGVATGAYGSGNYKFWYIGTATQATGGGGAHNHGFTQPSAHSFTPSAKSYTNPTFTGTQATLTHSHTVTVTNKDLNNMPPYLAVYCFKRTA